MPYTFAHPGFTLPLKQIKPELFSTTGFIFGSIAPDFDIILRLTNPRFHIFQYDAKNVFFVIFPIAICSAVYFHLVIRNILIEYSPTTIQRSMIRYKDFDFLQSLKKNSLRVGISILLAIYLHLFLDYISHLDAFPFKINAALFFQSFYAGIIFFYVAMYLPPVLFSLAGFWLIYKKLKEEQFKFNFLTDILIEDKSRIFIYSFILITLLAAIIKLYISGIETFFIIDSFAIGITNGLLISFFVTPTLFAFIRQLKNSGG